MIRILTVLIIASVCGCDISTKHDTKNDWMYWGSLPEQNPAHQMKLYSCKLVTYPISNMVMTESHEIDRPEPKKRIMGIPSATYLGNTCIRASLIMMGYESPELRDSNFYTIEVSYPVPDERCTGPTRPIFCNHGAPAHRVAYSRELSSDEVGGFFNGKKISDVIKYDEASGLVRFFVGNQVYEFTLPSR